MTPCDVTSAAVQSVMARRQGPGPVVQLLSPAAAPVLRPRSLHRGGLRLRFGGRCWQRGRWISAFSDSVGSQFPVSSSMSFLYPSCERDVKIPSYSGGFASFPPAARFCFLPFEAVIRCAPTCNCFVFLTS